MKKKQNIKLQFYLLMINKLNLIILPVIKINILNKIFKFNRGLF